MRAAMLPVLLLTVVLLAMVTPSSAIDRKRQLVNRPSDLMMMTRLRRMTFLPTYVKYFKEPAPVKGSAPGPASTQRPLQPRKGEYMCGDRICRLKAGEEPPHCDGYCQYPL